MSEQGPIYKRAALDDDDYVDDTSQSREEDDTEAESCFSKLNRPIPFLLFGMLASTMASAGTIYRSAAVTTLEKRFQLKSQQTALLPIITDITGVLTMLFVVHFGSSRHRPKVMATLLSLTGFGLILFCVPHFFYPNPLLHWEEDTGNSSSSDPYQSAVEGSVCSLSGGTKEPCTEEELEQSGALIGQAVWLFVGTGIVGLSTSFYPLFITHIDDGVRKKQLSVYMGIIFAVYFMGVLLAFLLAMVCLQIPAYITDPEFSQLTPYDPRFLGAWWLGFLILGIFQIVFAIPLFFFPRFLPKPKRGSKAQSGAEGEDEMTNAMINTAKMNVTTEEGEHFLVGLLRSVWRVSSNPTLFFCYCGYIALSLYFSGWAMFGPKYMQTQFGVSPYRTAFLSAIIMLPPGILGNIFGGAIVRVFGKTRRNIASLVIIVSLAVTLVEPIALVLGCENEQVAGLTVHYDQQLESDMDLPNLDVECNYGCNCESIYSPICGSDGTTYASACYAGCHNVHDGNTTTVYTGCSCVDTSDDTDNGDSDDGYGVLGLCSSGSTCQFLIPYLIWSPVVMTLGTMTAIPASLLQIRSVDSADRPMCLAVGQIAGKIFGFLPGPIIYGYLIDSACLMFQTSCGETGNCILYDNERYRYLFAGLNSILRTIGTSFFFLAYLSVRLGWDPIKEVKDASEDDHDDEVKQPISTSTDV